jgi:hypothetical protein
MEENNKIKTKSNFFFFLAVISVIIAFSFFLLSQNNNQKKVITVKPSPVIKPLTIGSLILQASDKKTVRPVNKVFDLVLNASSEGHNVVGYDLVMKYDGTAFTLIDYSSLLSNFKIYTFNKENYFITTGLKELNDTSVSPFKSTPILKFVFQAKQKGRYSFVIEPFLGKDKTQMVDDNTKILNPSINQFVIEIN